MNKPLSPEELIILRDVSDAMRDDLEINFIEVVIADQVLAGVIPFAFSNLREAFEAIV